MKSTTEMNVTSGNLFIKIIRFALPLMFTNIFLNLYSTVDLWTVSTFGGGPLSMSSISSNNSIINLILTLLISLTIGSNVLISIAKGENNKAKGERILHTSFTIAIVGGMIFGLLGFFVSPYILKIMDTPESIYDNACTYIRIYFLGCPLLMIYNFGAHMLRALGDSKRPFFILVISGITNVLVDMLFVIVFKMDVLGVALATVISEGLSALLIMLWFKYNRLSFVNLSFKKLKIHKEEFKEMLKLGIPSGLQGLAFCIPNIMIQSSLYSINDYYIDGTLVTQNEIISGSGASSGIENYIYTIVNTFGITLMSFVGQNFGARKKENIKKSYWYASFWLLIFSIGAAAVVLIMPFTLLRIFIKEVEGVELNIDAALLAGRERLYLLATTYFFDGLMDVNSYYLKGLKKTIPQMIITILGCSGTRILFLSTIFKMEKFHTIFWLYFSFPLSWIIVCIVYIPVVLYVQNKQFKLIENMKIETIKEPEPEL